MHVLLPPSEGKRVLAALAEVSARPDALAVLGVGASLPADVERIARRATVPSAAAETVFTVVLHDALDRAGLPMAARTLNVAPA